MKYALINSVIYTKNEVLRDYAVVIEGEYIQSVIPQNELESGIKTIDLKGHNLTAGFIDLQLNGCGGVMFNDQTSVETLEIMQATNLKSGCTSFLPTARRLFPGCSVLRNMQKMRNRNISSISW